MGTVYAITNQKGGVGKTTTAVNVGACIAEAGYTTLLVDVDPQANATVALGIPRARWPGLYEVLSGEASAPEAITRGSVPALQVLPAGEGLAGANVSVLNGADGLSEIAAGLVSQGLTILDSVRKGMPGQPQGRTADNGQVVSGQVAQREP